MEDESKVSVDDETKHLDTFSRNLRITEILGLVFNQPMTEKEMEDILFNFWDKYDKSMSRQEYFCEFDVLCMYMLDCVFKRNGPTLSAVSRSLYCYLKCLDLSEDNRIDIINGTEDDFVNALREFTNFSSAEEDILTEALIKSLLDGNYGLSIFLLKFGLEDIPTEAHEKSRKIVEKLVDRFNDILQYTIGNGQAEDLLPSINLDELLDLMRQSDIKPRRSLMTFFIIVAISEFRLHKKIELSDVKDWMNHTFIMRLICIYEIFDATTEVKLKFKDIETFTEKILNQLLNPDFGKSFLEFSINIRCHFFDNMKPTSLKDLTRSTIRKNLQNSMTFPEQVNRFDIPVDLKKFLLYHCEDIFYILKGSHHTKNYEQAIKLLINGNFPMI